MRIDDIDRKILALLLEDGRLTITELATRIGLGLRAAGVGWNLAPDVDVNAAPDNPVIGVRSFGVDPGLVSRHGSAWIRALTLRSSARSSGVATPSS